MENENAEMDSQRELAREVIHELLSLRALMSSVANERRRDFSSTTTGGQGSRMLCNAARLRRIMTSVPMRHPKAMLLKMATEAEYPTSPQKKVSTPAPARIPASPVDTTARRSVGDQSIQCFAPNPTGCPIRTCTRVSVAMTRRHDCRSVVAIHRRTAEPGSATIPWPDTPPRYS